MRKIACSIILISSLNAVAQTSSSMSLPQAPAVSTPATIAFPAPSQSTSSQASSLAVNSVKTNVVPGLMNMNPSKVFGSLSVGYSSNLYERTTYSSKTSSSADLVVNFRASGSNIIRGYAGGSRIKLKEKKLI